MYNIPNNIVDSYFSNESLNNLIHSIDNAMLRIATTQYNNIRLALTYKVDIDKYDDLKSYRYILLNLLLGCTCLQGQFLILIVSKIKKLIR